jgi:hypothetical protein
MSIPNPFRKKPAKPARPTLSLSHRPSAPSYTPEEAEDMGYFEEDALSMADALAARDPDEVGL